MTDETGQVILAILFCLYFLPAIIASTRRHKNATPIGIVNLFFGWTLIGWVGCLAWACTHQEAQQLPSKPHSPEFNTDSAYWARIQQINQDRAS